MEATGSKSTTEPEHRRRPALSGPARRGRRHGRRPRATPARRPGPPAAPGAAHRDRPEAEQQPGRDPAVRADRREPDRADHRAGHVAHRGRGRRDGRRRDARVLQPPPSDPAVLPPPLRAGPPLPPDRPAAQREPADADRLVLHPGVRAGVGGAVQPVDGLASRPVGPGAGHAAVHRQPAGDRRGAHLVDHVPQRDRRRRVPHPDGRADPVRHGAGAGAEHALRQEAVPSQAGRAGDRRPVHRAGPGDARRPVHARRAPARDPTGRCSRAGRDSASSSRSSRGC